MTLCTKRKKICNRLDSTANAKCKRNCPSLA